MKKDYTDASWLTDTAWGRWGKDDEVGALNELTPADVVRAVSLIKKGKVYDLETERFHGQPVWHGHPGFDLVTYATPTGRRGMTDSPYDPAYAWNKEGGWLSPEVNDPQYNAGLNTELLVGPVHLGTHIDGLCHLTVGEDDHWYNGFNQRGDYGPTKTGAETIPPIITRGVLLDIAGYKGVDHVDANYGITIDDIIGCAEWEGVEIRKNDCVLMRLGETWPEQDKCVGAGLTLEGARYLVEEKGAVLLGNDMTAFELHNADGTMSWPGHPHPVHDYCLIRQGVHFMELVQSHELAKDKVYEFCFVVASLKIRGATGMFIRPIAIV